MKTQYLKAISLGIGVLSVLATTHSAQAQPDFITTVVGSGPNNIPAIDANLNGPRGMAIDAQGNYYFASYAQNRVFKVSTGGIITVVAGTGFAGYGGDAGSAVKATLNGPNGVAVDTANPANIYISDSNNCLVRKISASGTITTIAGVIPSPGGHCGYGGDGGSANAAFLNYPLGLALNPANNDLYIADYNNGRVRKVSGGKATGTISTVAGGGGTTNNANCQGTAPYGDGAAANQSYLCYPQAIGVDSSVSPVNLFIPESSAGGRCTVREVVGSSSKIYLVAGGYNSCGYVDNTAATSAKLYNPWQVIASVSGSTTTINIADASNQRIRRFTLTYTGGVPKSGTITTVAGGTYGFCGDGGLATSACLNNPLGLARDASGNIYISDNGNSRIRKLTKSSGNISTVAGWGNPNYSNPIGVNGNASGGVSLYNPTDVFASSSKVYIGGYNGQADYVYDGSTTKISALAGNGIAGYAGDGSAANGAGVQLNYPQGVARDASGNVFIADWNNCVVREIEAADGKIHTVVGGNDNSKNGCGFSGDGGSARSAQIYNVAAITVDKSGNLYLADYSACVVRKVDHTSQKITTVAGQVTSGTAFHCGYTGDGSAALGAQLNSPHSVAVDGAGNLYIADFNSQRIRKVDAYTKIITTVAGDGTAGYSGDGDALGNSLYYPNRISVDKNGNLFIADQYNQIVRWVDPAGQMITFAGTPRTNGFGGDGALATNALLSYPSGVAQDSTGNFYVADYSNQLVRKVSAFAGYGRSTDSVYFSEEQTVGSTSGFIPVTLSAIGPVTISTVTAPTGFSEVDSCTGTALTAGQTCEIDVYFTPTKAGVTVGTLKIASNAFFSNQGNSVVLQGTAVGLTVSGPLTFPGQLIGYASSQSVTVKNTGPLVTLSKISVPGSTIFTVTGGSCKAGNTLASGAACSITVTFKPTSASTKKASLAIESSDPGSPLLAGLTGTGTQLTTSPSNLAFGTIAIGSTSTKNLTVTNAKGTFKLSPAISGSGFTILTTGNTCTSAIAAGKSCTLPVRFAPTSAKSYAGALTLSSDEASVSPVVALTGTGK